MHFITTALSAIAALAALASANTVRFESTDDVDRKVIFTPSAGLPSIKSVRVKAHQTVTVNFPRGWIGNWYSVSNGKANVPGMLGEVTFQGWNDLTYFDVSAIVNPGDHVGVAELYPAGRPEPVSGCKFWPCNNAYYLPDDVQTKTTEEVDLVCTLGTGN